jgi:hypothetical protein
LDRTGPISGLFDESGHDASAKETSHGTVNFRPVRK